MGDSMPIGSVIEYNGTDIPDGWEILPGDANVYIGSTEPNNGQEVWMQISQNLFRNSMVIQTSNVSFVNGVVTQTSADTKISLQWKLQGYQNGNYVGELISSITSNQTGRLSMTFQKSSSFNQMRVGLNGTSLDSLIVIDISSLVDGRYYTISFNITNTTQGSVSWRDIQIEAGQQLSDYTPYTFKKINIKNSDGTYNEFYSESNIYKFSTEETVVGFWWNNKPIYRKVIQASATTLPRSVSTGITKVDDLVTAHFQVKQSVGKDSGWRTLPWLYNSDYAGTYGQGEWAGGWYFNGDSGYLYVQAGSNISDIQKYIIILEYTKTTD